MFFCCIQHQEAIPHQELQEAIPHQEPLEVIPHQELQEVIPHQEAILLHQELILHLAPSLQDIQEVCVAAASMST